MPFSNYTFVFRYAEKFSYLVGSIQLVRHIVVYIDAKHMMK